MIVVAGGVRRESYFDLTRKAAVKLHVLLSLKGNVPAWGAITMPLFSDMKMLDQVPL